MRKLHSRVVCACAQRAARRALRHRSPFPQSEAREVLTGSCQRVSWSAGERRGPLQPGNASPESGRHVGGARAGSPPFQDGQCGHAQRGTTVRHALPPPCHPWQVGGGTSGFGVHAQLQWHLQPCRLIPVPLPMGPHRAQMGSLNIMSLPPGTTFPHTVTK